MSQFDLDLKQHRIDRDVDMLAGVVLMYTQIGRPRASAHRTKTDTACRLGANSFVLGGSPGSKARTNEGLPVLSRCNLLMHYLGRVAGVCFLTELCVRGSDAHGAHAAT